MSFSLAKYRIAIYRLKYAVRCPSFLGYLSDRWVEVFRCIAKLSSRLEQHFTATSFSVSFWLRIKRGKKPDSVSLRSLIAPSGEVIKGSKGMCEMAADYYEALFCKVKNMFRPHPYSDAPCVSYDNVDEVVPKVTMEELTCII